MPDLFANDPDRTTRREAPEPCHTCKGAGSVHPFGRTDRPRILCGACGGSGKHGFIRCG